jgi:hypothetical protein
VSDSMALQSSQQSRKDTQETSAAYQKTTVSKQGSGQQSARQYGGGLSPSGKTRLNTKDNVRSSGYGQSAAAMKRPDPRGAGASVRAPASTHLSNEPPR